MRTGITAIDDMANGHWEYLWVHALAVPHARMLISLENAFLLEPLTPTGTRISFTVQRPAGSSGLPYVTIDVQESIDELANVRGLPRYMGAV